ncbi:MAG: TetR/AcrR family transcriptional regulator [Clostridia bacterium]|nr:TetR/AcrR family transcriptional regulator [Clostridia bacterium]
MGLIEVGANGNRLCGQILRGHAVQPPADAVGLPARAVLPHPARDSTNAIASNNSEKPIHKVTVRELCAKADINRSTFYAYYETPYDILKELETAIIERTMIYLNDVDDPITHRDALIRLLTFYESNRTLYLILLSNTQDGCYFDNLTNAAGVWINRSNSTHGRNSLADFESYKWNFNTAGSVKLVRDWLKSDPRIPAPDLADILLLLCKIQ